MVQLVGCGVGYVRLLVFCFLFLLCFSCFFVLASWDFGWWLTTVVVLEVVVW